MLKAYFPHGLGDCVYFAHQLPLYVRRGHSITVSCSPDKRIMFSPCGVMTTTESSDAARVQWYEGFQPDAESTWYNGWYWSKPARNLSLPPMPDIGTPEELWHEYCNVRLNIWPHIPAAVHASVENWIKPLRRPLILLHTHGNTFPRRKNLGAEHCRRLYHGLLRHTDAVVLLLDWDNRAPRMVHERIRHLTDDWTRLDTAQLISLLGRADLVIGVDSGPLHATRYVNTPAIGLWLGDGAPPRWSLPRTTQLNLVVGKRHHQWSSCNRFQFNIADCDSPNRMIELLPWIAARMLKAPRYLHATHIGADVLLQWMVEKRMHDYARSSINYVDHSRGTEVLLEAVEERFLAPRVVQIGLSCGEEDFAAGRAIAYVLGCYLYKQGGKLIVISENPEQCSIARAWTQCFEDAVEVVTESETRWLKTSTDLIDVLYVSSSEPADQTRNRLVDQMEAAYPRLHGGSIVVFDKTAYTWGSYRGPGAAMIPWLKQRGWVIAWSGHQMMLCARLLRTSGIS